jgi:hypothetical protein
MGAARLLSQKAPLSGSADGSGPVPTGDFRERPLMVGPGDLTAVLRLPAIGAELAIALQSIVRLEQTSSFAATYQAAGERRKGPLGTRPDPQR